MGVTDVEGVLYGQMMMNETLDGPSGDFSKDHGDNDTSNPHSHLTPTKSEEHRHEELIDQDVRDVLIDAIKRGQVHRDARRFDECRSLFETACGSASALLPVDSDHRGRLQLAVARAESMGADRACAILKYAMDDVLRSGLSLRQGRYPQMDVNERSDCVLSRPNPLRSTPSRGYDVSNSWDANNTSNFSSGALGGDANNTSIEQSAEEALNSLVEEMKEILEAPVYNMTPLQRVSEKFWLALSDAKKHGAKKEERLEQALAKIKADFLMAREEYEEQLAAEREKVESLKRRFNVMRSDYPHHPSQTYNDGEERYDGGPNRPQSVTSRSTGSGQHNNNIHYHFGGMDDNNTTTNDSHGSSQRFARYKNGSSQSVVSLGSEFAQKAKGLVHLLNCQGKEVREPGGGTTTKSATGSPRYGNDDSNGGRPSPR